jgi:hypothetical protein
VVPPVRRAVRRLGKDATAHHRHAERRSTSLGNVGDRVRVVEEGVAVAARSKTGKVG